MGREILEEQHSARSYALYCHLGSVCATFVTAYMMVVCDGASFIEQRRASEASHSHACRPNLPRRPSSAVTFAKLQLRHSRLSTCSTLIQHTILRPQLQ